MKSMAHNVGSGVKEVTNAVKQKVGTVTNNMKSDAHTLGEDITIHLIRLKMTLRTLMIIEKITLNK